MRRVAFGVMIVVALATTSLGASANMLVNGDFEAGNSGFASDYQLDATVPVVATYTVASTVPNGWAPGFGDHTTGTGLMGIFNASDDPDDRVWAQTLDLTLGTSYRFEGWVSALTESIRPGTAPILELRVGGVAKGVFNTAALDDTWQAFMIGWIQATSGSFEVSLHDLRAVGSGDDFALDDLVLVPEPSTGLLLAGALTALGIRRRRSR